jgi:hypothetical protein
LLDQTTTV